MPVTGLRPSIVVTVGLFVVLCVGLAGVVAVDSVSGEPAPDVYASSTDPGTNGTVSEEKYVEKAPEPGDEYYEATDGNWVSYINPRDEYRSPYLGDASGKVCVTLLNEAGDPIVGETVPNTTVTVPIDESLSWHSAADPMTVTYPLTDHYERPLDADQFGTTPDLPQGDGYMDTHCIEWHGLPEDETVEYGEARIEGEHADRIETVGYVQQAHDTWDTDVDPIEDAEPYEDAGGGWTYTPDHSHGQAVVVLQLEGSESIVDDYDEGGNTSDDERNESSVDGETTDSSDGDDDDEHGEDDRVPGFGLVGSLVALAVVALVGLRRRAT